MVSGLKAQLNSLSWLVSQGDIILHSFAVLVCTSCGKVQLGIFACPKNSTGHGTVVQKLSSPSAPLFKVLYIHRITCHLNSRDQNVQNASLGLVQVMHVIL